jgi:hypothetical protein
MMNELTEQARSRGYLSTRQAALIAEEVKGVPATTAIRSVRQAILRGTLEARREAGHPYKWEINFVSWESWLLEYTPIKGRKADSERMDPVEQASRSLAPVVSTDRWRRVVSHDHSSGRED